MLYNTAMGLIHVLYGEKKNQCETNVEVLSRYVFVPYANKITVKAAAAIESCWDIGIYMFMSVW